MAWDYESTKAGYEAMWSSAEILESAHYDLDMIADVIIKNEEQYRWVEEETGVPWFWIGAIHSRESSCDFTTHLHNGDPLTARTTHVPAGRPTEGDPPFTWEESAMDALAYQDLIGIEPWDCAQMHLQAEIYNGLGYVSHETNSPYLWAGSTHQEPGKFVADGVWDESAWDSQMGDVGHLEETVRAAARHRRGLRGRRCRGGRRDTARGNRRELPADKGQAPADDRGAQAAFRSRS